MTKKKRNHPGLDEILARPWCYYCERDFDDLKILINHQKAKHFKCERCGRRLNTAGGLSVHMSQVHKENLTAVDNALPNRAGLDIEIFGMEGIPEDIVQQHTQRVLTSYHQAQAERQAATGNPAPGFSSSTSNGHKKPRLESTSDLKKRLAEHKAAKLAAEQGDSSQSERSTPQPVALPQGSPTNGYVQAAASTFSAPPTSYSPTSAVPGLAQQLPYGHLPAAAVAYQPQSYTQPPQSPFQPSFSPPPPSLLPPHQSAPAFVAGQPFQPPTGSGQQYANPTSAAPRLGSNPNSTLFSGHPSALVSPAPSSTNGASFPMPIASGSVSLPTAPGLPQRPAFGAPPVNALQFQQMHQGQLPSPPNLVTPPQYRSQNSPANNSPTNPVQAQAHDSTAAAASASTGQAPLASSIDDLIASASKQADAAAAVPTTTAAAAAAAGSGGAAAEPQVVAGTSTHAAAEKENTDDKTVKKDKEKTKATRLVYSDNEISPEEKMATLPRYAFNHSRTVVV